VQIRKQFVLSTTLASLAAFSFLAVACGDDDDDDDEGTTTATATTGTSAAGDDNEVTVGDNSFSPASLTISAGDTVTWTWSGDNPHSLVGTSDNATDLIESDQMTGSGTAEVTFDEAGTYEYECGVHGSSMSGTIVVE
jgi:plastocyanin